MNKKPIPRDLRQRISGKFNHQCCYCHTQEEIAGNQFDIDHVIPISLGGETVEENLCLACSECNKIKHIRIAANDSETGEMVSLFNPNLQNWADHFSWDSDGVLIIGITPTGRATVTALNLNRAHLVRARERWVQAGWHPPE